jgi:hypothetical protein
MKREEREAIFSRVMRKDTPDRTPQDSHDFFLGLDSLLREMAAEIPDSPEKGEFLKHLDHMKHGVSSSTTPESEQ